MSDIAFITGIAGQDGAYLAKFLLDKGYEVHGLLRWDSASAADEGQSRLVELGLKDKGLIVHTGDITDANALTALIKKIKPTEIYNLAALSQVHVSFETPASTFDINAKGTLNILEAVRVLGREKDVRIYQASSSEMFGSTPPPQNEQSAMMPCNLYGPGDMFDETTSHVIPALMLKCHLAKTQGENAIDVWGSGQPLREFLYVDDLADALVFTLKNYSSPEILNIGAGEDITIKDLAALVAKASGFEGELRFDASKPDGVFRKLMNSDRIQKAGWSPQTSLKQGLEQTYAWFSKQNSSIKNATL